MQACLQRPETPAGPAKADLLQQDPGAADLLRAQRVEEARNELVHQLEIGRQRRGVLLCAVEHLLGELLRVERRAGPAVDEDELRREDEPLRSM